MKTFKLEDKTLKQVYRPTAKKLFLEGATIYMLPRKANPLSYWIHPTIISLSRFEELDLVPESFDSLVNKFEYYNCNETVGKYANFYVEV